MYKYKVELDDNFEPSNQEQRTQVNEYYSSFDPEKQSGLEFIATDAIDCMKQWKVKYPRIDFFANVIIKAIEEKSTNTLLYIKE